VLDKFRLIKIKKIERMAAGFGSSDIRIFLTHYRLITGVLWLERLPRTMKTYCRFNHLVDSHQKTCKFMFRASLFDVQHKRVIV